MGDNMDQSNKTIAQPSLPEQVSNAPVSAPMTKKEEITDFTKTLVLAILLALFIRGFFFEPFNIPSGSMKPTLLIGDYIATNKYDYGYGQYSFSVPVANIFLPVPYQGRVWAGDVTRGEIVVFWMPQFQQNYIKRVVGLPGDTIQMRRGRLYINDELVEREFVALRSDKEDDGSTVAITEYIETLPGGIMHQIYEESDQGPLDDTPQFTVPEGQYFVMGDNRDNSQDSRVSHSVGPIPFEHIVGRADFVFFSSNGSARIFELWKWPWSIRYERMFMSIDPISPEGT
jgi:signal peptidase I